MRNTAFFFLILLFSSCEKGINFKLNNADQKLVVEAQIETNQPPIVILSKSFNYFSKITRDQLANSFVRNADIWVSNGVKTHKLIEYSYKVDSTQLYYYSVNPADPLTSFTGEEGGSYSLKIVADSKEYNAVTTIPLLTKKVDSLWWAKAPQNPDTTKVVLKARITDPPQYGNYIRYFTRVNSQRFLAGENSVFDDQVLNGVTYNVDVDKGVDRNANTPADEKGFFHRGDTVTLKFCNIDKATYDFWRTMEFNYSSIGNPFSSPNKVLGNISNGALGYFGGYAPQFKSIIIPK
ncbi:MAG: DUF4249 domain-containing protein [Sphingobacteriales bacterium]|nr:MAG: DUF4249 domain-containing protein [Sphingobacteriales bacterium]